MDIKWLMAILLLDGWTVERNTCRFIGFKREEESILYDKWNPAGHNISYDNYPETGKQDFASIYHLAKFLGYAELC